MKTKYSDFIGERIEVEISPYSGHSSSYPILRKELFRRIRAELTYENGLLCQFENVKTEINNKIIVSATVKQCEVDC
jgi:hypothetical protein